GSARFEEDVSWADLPRRLLLLAGVGQVVEVDALAVAVDPCRDEPEAVEAGAGGPVAGAEVQADGLRPQRHRDPAAPRRGSGRVVQGPGVGRPAGEDPRPGVAAGTPLPRPADAIKGVEKESFAAGPLDGHAQKAPRQSRILRRVYFHAVLGVEEAE